MVLSHQVEQDKEKKRRAPDFQRGAVLPGPSSHALSSRALYHRQFPYVHKSQAQSTSMSMLLRWSSEIVPAITSKLATQPLHKVWQQIPSGPGLANPHGQGPAGVGASAHQIKMMDFSFRDTKPSQGLSNRGNTRRSLRARDQR